MHALNTAPVSNLGSISVESLVYISGFPVRTLFDSGTSHTFISSEIVENLHLSTSLVEDPVSVSNPIGGSAHLSMICVDLKISISVSYTHLTLPTICSV